MSQRKKPATQPVLFAPSWSPTARIVALILAIAFCLLLFWLARPVWSLLLLSIIVAYLLQPMVGGLNRLRVPRGLGAIVVVLLTITILIFLPIVLVPALLNDISPISIDIPQVLNTFVKWVQSLPRSYAILAFTIDLTPIIDQVTGFLTATEISTVLPSSGQWFNVLTSAIRSAGSVVGAATNLAAGALTLASAAIFSFILFLLFVFYFLKDLPELREHVVALAPAPFQPEWHELWRRTGRVWQAFFRGQIGLSLAVGIASWGGLTFLGIPGSLALGVIAALFELLPNIGPLLALIPAVLLAALQGSTTYPDVSRVSIILAVVALYVLIQMIENYVLVPRILGGSVGLHPALVVIGVLVGAAQFGVVGAFVATPLLATMKVWAAYVYPRLLGQYPYPELLAAGAKAASASLPAPPPDPTADVRASGPAPDADADSTLVLKPEEKPGRDQKRR